MPQAPQLERSSLTPTRLSHRLRGSRWTYAVLGVVLGCLLLLGIRYFTYNPRTTHYHANFAVYINGQREAFASPRYYEEIQLCSLHGSMVPAARAHMHDQVNDVVHVHDAAVTWGQFFENIGWIVGPDFIRTPVQLYVASNDTKLHVLLNGQDLTDISSITNTVIGDKDRLLLSFGTVSTATLEQEADAVAQTAAAADSGHDPASCSDSHAVSSNDRLHHLF